MNVNDPEVLRFVYPSSDMAWDGAQYLRKHELSIFSEKNGARFQMSKTVGALESQAACFGSVSTVEPIAENVPGIYRVTGWVWDQRNRRPPVAVFAESGGNSAGRFALGAWLPTIRAQHHEIKSSYIGFSGYVSQPSPSDSVILYALLPGRPQWVCRFAVIDLLAPSPHAH
jgi:hypothetical protein